LEAPSVDKKVSTLAVKEHGKRAWNGLIWFKIGTSGGVLGSVEGGTNKCVRQGVKESGQICTSYELFELGNFGVE